MVHSEDNRRGEDEREAAVRAAVDVEEVVEVTAHDARGAAHAEELDAHRKRQQAAHPALTLTGMYNVLEKLHSGEALTAWREAAALEASLESAREGIARCTPRAELQRRMGQAWAQFIGQVNEHGWVRIVMRPGAQAALHAYGEMLGGDQVFRRGEVRVEERGHAQRDGHLDGRAVEREVRRVDGPAAALGAAPGRTAAATARADRSRPLRAVHHRPGRK